MSARHHRMIFAGSGIAGAVVALAVMLGGLAPAFLLFPLFLAVFGVALRRGGATGADGRGVPAPLAAPAVAATPGEAVVPAAPTVPSRPWWRRANHAFGPILAGLVIDAVDFATFGPIGLVLGLPVGGLAGYWMGRALGLSTRGARWCAIASGVYCMVPGTELIPMATIIGAFVRFKQGRTPSRKTPARRRRRPRARPRAVPVKPDTEKPVEPAKDGAA